MKIVEGLANGKYIRNGGVIQDTAGRVITWLKDNPNVMPNIAHSVSNFSPIGVLHLLIDGTNVLVTKNRLDTISGQVDQLQKRLGTISVQVDQLQNLAMFSSAASLLTLGVTAIGFTTIYKKVQGLETQLKAVQLKLKDVNEKIDIGFYSNFRAALDLARNAFSMEDESNRRSSALQAINRFLEAEHIYLDLTDKELEKGSPIADEYLLTLCLAFIAEVRCYLELCEYGTARRRLEEGKTKVRSRMIERVDNLLTSNPVMYLHPSLTGVVDLSRLTSIYQWKNPSATENSVFEEFREHLGKTWDLSEWSKQFPASIMEQSKIKRNFFGLDNKSQNAIFDRLPKAINEIEEIIETNRRFESYEYELKLLEQTKIPFSKWLNTAPETPNTNNSNLIFITPEEPLTL